MLVCIKLHSVTSSKIVSSCSLPCEPQISYVLIVLVAFRTKLFILVIKSHCVQGKIHLLRNMHLDCRQQSYNSVLDLDCYFHVGTVVFDMRAISTQAFFISVFMILQLTMNDFSVHRIIGRGGFGEVYGCRKADTGKMYAMKCLDKKRIKMKQGETLALNERIMLSLVSTGVSLFL